MNEYLGHLQIFITKNTTIEHSPMPFLFIFIRTLVRVIEVKLLEQLINFTDIAKLISNHCNNLHPNYQCVCMREPVYLCPQQQRGFSFYLIIDSLLCEKRVLLLLSFSFNYE